MDIIRYPKTIFIIGGDSGLSLSLKCLLETHERVVRIFDRCEEFWGENVHSHTDLVILNFEHRGHCEFKLLNCLLKSETCPKIVITAVNHSIFQASDSFAKDRVTFLFQPFTPRELLKTIEHLA